MIVGMIVGRGIIINIVTMTTTVTTAGNVLDVEARVDVVSEGLGIGERAAVGAGLPLRSGSLSSIATSFYCGCIDPSSVIIIRFDSPPKELAAQLAAGTSMVRVNQS